MIQKVLYAVVFAIVAVPLSVSLANPEPGDAADRCRALVSAAVLPALQTIGNLQRENSALKGERDLLRLQLNEALAE